MSDIFEPVVEKIIKLVKGQILATNKKISAIILVGGFGQNNYLKERLRSSVGKSILVLQPPNAWTAVVRGAVMMGLARANSKLAAVGLVSRAARKHYGIELRVEFEPGIHDASKK
jgi:molecular chaperone DnaK (HSP70)